MDNTNRFYVYALLDPRKKGAYCYPDIPVSFLYEPFYIGKGQTTRAQAHFSEKIEKTANPFKVNKINKILKETGKNPLLIKIIKNSENKEALEAEILFIKNIGRGKLGPLTNLTDGGEGMIGYKHTERAIELIKESNKRRGVSENTKAKISEGVKLTNFRPTENMRKAMSIRMSGENNFFYGKRFFGADNHMYGKHLSNKQRKVISALAKKRVGLKNPNMKYCYCLYNTKTEEQYHAVFNVSSIMSRRIALKKNVSFRRFHGWIIVRCPKKEVIECPCKTILKENIQITDIKYCSDKINQYLK